MKNKKYSAETLLDVLESYLLQIDRSTRDFSSVTLSDIRASITYVLQQNNRL